MIWKLKDFVVSSNLEYFGGSSLEIDSGGASDEIISLGNQGRRRDGGSSIFSRESFEGSGFS
jgi:hypothetical protein